MDFYTFTILVLAAAAFGTPVVPDWITEETKYASKFDVAFNPALASGDLNARSSNTLVARYIDGEGKYLTSDSEHRYATGVKCWTDYFLVEKDTRVYDEAWEQSSGRVYCKGTRLCQVNQLIGKEHCETFSIELSLGVKQVLYDESLKVGFSTQQCNSASSTTICQWNDGGCHVIWSSQQMLSQRGYQRRRCASGHGDETYWTKDFVRRAPTKFVSYDCEKKCTDTT